jgi:hypothetical protein
MAHGHVVQLLVISGDGPKGKRLGADASGDVSVLNFAAANKFWVPGSWATCLSLSALTTMGTDGTAVLVVVENLLNSRDIA